MPPLGVLVGKRDLSDYFITLSPGHYDTLAQAKAAGAATLNYGLFINAILFFLIVAFAVFLAVRQMNAMVRKAPNTKECPQCRSAVPIDATRCKFCTQLV